MQRYAQAKQNVPRRPARRSRVGRGEVERLNDELDGRGRVLVRPSGTEPLVRVLAEAERAEEAEELCASIARLVRQGAGSGKSPANRASDGASAPGSTKETRMCGIIGYVGPRECKMLLLHGLERLEYRGYDSAGIALLEEGGLTYTRAVGNLAEPARARR